MKYGNNFTALGGTSFFFFPFRMYSTIVISVMILESHFTNFKCIVDSRCFVIVIESYV